MGFFKDLNSLVQISFHCLRCSLFRIEKVLDEIASGKAVIDMERMTTVIHREILDGLDKVGYPPS